jgi:hypothetical protein
MTEKKLYIHAMKILSVTISISLLLAPDLSGGIAVFLLLVVCFVLVHTVKLAMMGYEFYKKTEKEQKKDDEETPSPTTAKPAPPPAPSPIYYLVEKKRVKKKPEQKFEEPKKINFEE